MNFNTPIELKAYLYTCVHNEIVNIFMKNERQKKFANNQLLITDNVIDHIVMQETLDRLRNAVDELPPRLRNSEDTDILCVDDMTLNYEPVPTAMYIFDTPVTGFTADCTEYDITLPEAPTEDDIDFDCVDDLNYAVLTHFDEAQNGNPARLVANLYSEDLKTFKTYTFNVNIDTAIDGINADNNTSAAGRYNISGQKVGKNARGLIITRYADGKVVKTVK